MNDIIKSLLLYAYLLVDRIVTLFPGVTSAKKNILMIVRMDNIGDYVVWHDSLRKLKEQYGGYDFVLICNNSYSRFASDCDDYEKVVGVDPMKLTKSLIYRWGVLRTIRKIDADIAIQPTFSRNMFSGDSLVRASAATQRIGSIGDYSNITRKQKKISDKWYTRLVSASSGFITEFERNAEFLKGIGIESIVPRISELDCGALDIESLGLPENYFIIFPGASWVGRMWPHDSFAKTLNRIHEKYNIKPVLCGSASEFDICESIIKLSGNADALNLSGKTSLSQFAGVVKGAALLVGNETSAVHIAAAVSTPSICILGGGHFGRFVPYPEMLAGNKPVPVYFRMPCYGCNWSCTQPHNPDECVPCISNIDVETVLGEVDKINFYDRESAVVN